MSDPEPPPQTSEEDVAYFLANKQTPNRLGKPKPGDAPPNIAVVKQELELTEESAALLNATATKRSVPLAEGEEPTQPEEAVSPTPPPKLDSEVSPLVDPEAPSQQQSVAWAMRDAYLGLIEVTDEEKALYLKAALNDKPVIWDIRLLHGAMIVQVRSISHYEVDVVFRAIRFDEAEDIIKTPEAKFSRLQWYTCCLQVQAVQGVGQDHLQFQHGDHSKLEQDAQTLRKHYETKYRELSSPRWGQMLTSVRVFSIKEKLCTDALANEDFWTPVDGD